MNHRSTLTATCTVAVCVVILALSSIRAVQPQGKPSSELRDDVRRVSVKLDERGSSLSTILAVLAGQAEWSFMTDGLPMRTAMDLRFEGPLSDALDMIATAFDMEWEYEGVKTVSLARRFTSWEDFPSLGISEIKAIAVRVSRAIEAVAYDREPGAYEKWMHRFYRSLGMDQRRDFMAGKTLFYRDLAVGQRDMIRQSIVSGQLGRLASPWLNLRAIMNDLPRGKLVIKESRGITESPVVTVAAPILGLSQAEFAALIPQARTGRHILLNLAEIRKLDDGTTACHAKCHYLPPHTSGRRVTCLECGGASHWRRCP